MAYEYLNEATDRMFEILKKDTAINILIADNAVSVALAFYESVLRKGKFRSQRWHFQHHLFDFNAAFTAGYFNKRMRELSPTVQDDIKEYLKQKNSAQ